MQGAAPRLASSDRRTPLPLSITISAATEGYAAPYLSPPLCAAALAAALAALAASLSFILFRISFFLFTISRYSLSLYSAIVYLVLSSMGMVMVAVATGSSTGLWNWAQ